MMSTQVTNHPNTKQTMRQPFNLTKHEIFTRYAPQLYEAIGDLVEDEVEREKIILAAVDIGYEKQERITDEDMLIKVLRNYAMRATKGFIDRHGSHRTR